MTETKTTPLPKNEQSIPLKKEGTFQDFLMQYDGKPIQIGDNEINPGKYMWVPKENDPSNMTIRLVKFVDGKRQEIDVLHNNTQENSVDWDTIDGVVYRDNIDAPEGQRQELFIPKKSIKLISTESIGSSPSDDSPSMEYAEYTETPTQHATPPEAVNQLENRAHGNTVVIVAEKGNQAKVAERVNKDMEQEKTIRGIGKLRPDRLVKNVLKNGIFKDYFEERARQIRTKQQEAAGTYYSDNIIAKAEEKAQQDYQDLLTKRGTVLAGITKVGEWVKSNVGMETLVQEYTLTRIATLKDVAELQQLDSAEQGNQAVIDRFGEALNETDEAIRHEMGETLIILQDGNEDHTKLLNGLRDIVKKQITEGKTKQEVYEAMKQLISTEKPNVAKEADYYATSLYEAAEQLQVRLQQEDALSQLDAHIEKMNFRIGVALLGEATSLEPSATQKAMERMRKIINKNERMATIFAANEATIGAGVSALLALQVLPRAGITGAARVVLSPLGGAAVGGTFGAYREYWRLRKDFLIHLRERESGMMMAEMPSERRAFFERYAKGLQRNANDLIKGMRDPLVNNEGSVKTTITIQELRQSCANYADARARRNLTNQQNNRLGLIQYDDRDQIEIQRTLLERQIRATRDDIITLINGDPALAQELLLGVEGLTIETFLDTLTTSQEKILTQGKTEVEGLADPYKRALADYGDFVPEADVLKRRFLILGKKKQGASGIEEMMAGFKAEARGRAIRYGMTQAAVGVTISEGLTDFNHLITTGQIEAVGPIGAGVRAVQERISGVDHLSILGGGPLSDTGVDINGRQFLSTQDIHMTPDGTGNVIITGPDGDSVTISPSFDATGNVSPDLANQLRDAGIHLDVNRVGINISGNIHALPLGGGQEISVPQELQFVTDGGGNHDLVLTLQDINGHSVQHIVADNVPFTGVEPTNPTDVMNAIRNFAAQDHSPLHIIETGAVGVVPADLHINVVDAAGVPHAITADIPTGAQLINDGSGNFSFTIPNPADAAHPIVVDNIQFGTNGELINSTDTINRINTQLQTVGLHMNWHPDITPIAGGAGANGTFDMPVNTMGNSQGREGMFGWFRDYLDSTNAQHTQPTSNFATKIFRGWSEQVMPNNDHIENFRGSLIDGKPNLLELSENSVVHDIPSSLFSDTGLTKMSGVMNIAYQAWQNNTPFTSPTLLTELQTVLGHPLTPADAERLLRMTYEIGLVSRPATGDEVRFLMDQFGGGGGIDLHHNIFTLSGGVGFNTDATVPEYILRSRGLDPFPAVPLAPREAMERMRRKTNPLHKTEYFDSYPDYVIDQYNETNGENGSKDMYSEEYLESLEQKIEELSNGYKELSDIELQQYEQQLYEMLGIEHPNGDNTYVLSQQDRIRQLAEKLNITVDYNENYRQQLTDLYSAYLTRANKENRQIEINKKLQQYPEEYIEKIVNSLEELQKPNNELNEQQLKDYEQKLYDALGLSYEAGYENTENSSAAKLNYLYEYLHVQPIEGKTYQENLIQLYSVLLDRSEIRLRLIDRLKTQQNYLDSLKDKRKVDSKDPSILRMLYRLNGATRDYYQELESLNASLPPMHPDCKMAVVIPAYNEEARIENCIKDWVIQYTADQDKPIDPNSFEIIVFVNRQNSNVSYDKTIEIVQALQKDPQYQNFHIHLLEKTYNISSVDQQVVINGENVHIPKGRRMGLIYGMATDIAILRNINREAPEIHKANFILKTGGADAFARSPYYIDESFKVFESNPSIEQYNSRADYPPQIYEHLPLFHVTERFREMMNLQYTNRKSALGLGVYRAAAYTEANGFNPNDEIAEEVRLNERMRAVILRKAQENGKRRKDVIKRDLKLRAIDDPRRALAAVWQGVPMVDCYSNFWGNTKVKEMEVSDILNQTVPPEAEFTPENIRLQLEPYVRYYTRMIYLHHPDQQIKNNLSASLDLAKKYAHRSFTFLGFDDTDYEITVDASLQDSTKVDNLANAVEKINLEIKNTTKVAQLVEEYKDRQKPDWTRGNDDTIVPPQEPPPPNDPETFASTIAEIPKDKTEMEKRREKITELFLKGITTEEARKFITSDVIQDYLERTLMRLDEVINSQMEPKKKDALTNFLLTRINTVSEHVSTIEESGGIKIADVRNTQSYTSYQLPFISDSDIVGKDLLLQETILVLNDKQQLLLSAKKMNRNGKDWNAYQLHIHTTTNITDQTEAIDGMFGGIAEGFEIGRIASQANNLERVLLLVGADILPSLTREYTQMQGELRGLKKDNTNPPADIAARLIIGCLNEAKLSVPQITELFSLNEIQVKLLEDAQKNLNDTTYDMSPLAHAFRENIQTIVGIPVLDTTQWANFL